jgi:hypothetical protein
MVFLNYDTKSTGNERKNINWTLNFKNFVHQMTPSRSEQAAHRMELNICKD